MGKYLTVDEQATYIDVTGDGFRLRISDGDSYIYDTNAPTTIHRIYERIYISSTTYNYVGNRSNVLLENTPLRVVIRQSGNYGASPPSGSESVETIWVIYPDRAFHYWSWETSGSVAVDDVGYNAGYRNAIIGLYDQAGTNEAMIYENSGTESSGDQDVGLWTNADYIGTTCDEMNIIIVPISVDVTGDATAAIVKLGLNSESAYFYLDNGNIGHSATTETHTAICALLFDSADRENDGGTFLDWDTDIDTNAVTVGTICEQSADALRYYCHTAHTAGAGNEPPNTSYWHEYRMTIGDQYKDLVMAAPDAGSEVTDLVIPADLSSDGFAADGARHIEMTAQALCLYTNDIARIGHVDLIHDPMITTDGSIDLVVGHWKCDDNAATTTILDATGNNNGTLGGGDNTEDKDNADAVQGTSLLLNGTDDDITLDGALSEITDFDRFALAIWFKPNFDYDTANYHYLFSLEQAWNYKLYLRYNPNDDDLVFRSYLEGSGQSQILLNNPSNVELRQWHYVYLAFDLLSDRIWIYLNGNLISVLPVAQDWASDPTAFTIGSDDGSNYGAYFIDNIKLIDGCLLPYGAYFTGNGAVDTDVAHADITFLWQGADATPIGTDVTNDGGDYVTDGPIGTKAFDNSDAGDNASAATSGNISAAEGSLSFWFKPNAALSADCTLFYADAAFKIWWDDSDNDVVFTYNTDVLNMTTAFAAGDTNWHHVCCQWKASDSLYIIVDGAVTSLLTGVDAAPTLDATMYFTADDADGTNRADVLMSDFFITDKITTPQIPVVLGAGPIYAPIREIS